MKKPHMTPKTRALMARWFISLGIATTGIMLFAFGMLYGVIMVNVPYQDPTPAQSASENFHMAIWFWVMGIGLCVLAIGLLAFCTQTALYLVQKRVSSTHG